MNRLLNFGSDVGHALSLVRRDALPFARELSEKTSSASICSPMPCWGPISTTGWLASP